MSLPPMFTSVTSTNEGTRAVADTTAVMNFAPASCVPGNTSSITLSATDPEGDQLTYLADFVPAGMSWDPATRTLTYVAGPTCPTNVIYYIRFRVTTPSGGTDALIAAVDFTPGGLRATGGFRSELALDAPTVPSGAFVVTAPAVAGAPARLTIFDIVGRRIAMVRGKGGEQLIWERRDAAGALVSTGVYLYRVEAGGYRREGKVVVIR